MPVGVTLSEMSQQTRAILGYSLNPAFGVDQEAALREGLRRTQTDLWVMHDWPMLIQQSQKTLQKGSRYVLIPGDMDFNHINAVYARNEPNPVTTGGSWLELEYGITPDDLNQTDSDLQQTSFPIKKYQPTNEDPSGIEVWPIPNQSCQVLFVGRCVLKPLVSDFDVCTLDSDLIIATYAAQMMIRNGNKDAELQLSRAQQILNRLRARQGANKRRPWVSRGYLEGGVF
jgi:hypothetical protein